MCTKIQSRTDGVNTTIATQMLKTKTVKKHMWKTEKDESVASKMDGLVTSMEMVIPEKTKAKREKDLRRNEVHLTLI